MEKTLRRAVADYELDEELAPGRFRARPPERLRLGAEGEVLVWEISTDGSRWRDLSTDLRAFSSVDSPNLLRLFETGPDLDPVGAGAYLATEYPAGGWLGAPVSPMRLGEQIRAVAGAARGAHALHEGGIAHGSISGESIFVTNRGGVLGPPLARAADPAVLRVDRWQTMDVLDPELLRGGSPGRATDCWALAATLHQVCSGGALHPGLEDAPTVTGAQMVLFGAPEVADTVPPDLAELLEACFDRNPAERPATALVLAERLEQIQIDGVSG